MKKLKFIGSGVYGNVYETTHNGEKIAAKYIKNKKSFTTELKIFQHINNYNFKNIVYMKNYDINSQIIYMDFINDSISLENMIKYCPQNNDIIKEKYFSQILKSVLNLIKIKVFHGDFKAKNILISKKTNNIYIHDFGLSQIKNVNLNDYKKSLCIILLQLFLEHDEIIDLINECFDNEELYDVSENDDLPEFNRKIGLNYPNSFNTVFHLCNEINLVNFLKKNFIKNTYARKIFEYLITLEINN